MCRSTGHLRGDRMKTVSATIAGLHHDDSDDQIPDQDVTDSVSASHGRVHPATHHGGEPLMQLFEFGVMTARNGNQPSGL